jgi:hypothetical protein
MLVVKAQITRGAGVGAIAAVVVASVDAVDIFSIVAGCKHLLRANVAGSEEDAVSLEGERFQVSCSGHREWIPDGLGENAEEMVPQQDAPFVAS